MVIPHFSGDELRKILALYCNKYSITRASSVAHPLLLWIVIPYF